MKTNKILLFINDAIGKEVIGSFRLQENNVLLLLLRCRGRRTLTRFLMSKINKGEGGKDGI